MREHLYRGIRKDNGEWAEGCLCVNSYGVTFIVYDGDFTPTSDCCGKHLVADRFFEVLPETVGEFTGEKDSNEKKIFEGDIVEFFADDNAQVKFEYGCFWVEDDEGTKEMSKYYTKVLTVIGNIYENPELLEVEE